MELLLLILAGVCVYLFLRLNRVEKQIKTLSQRFEGVGVSVQGPDLQSTLDAPTPDDTAELDVPEKEVADAGPWAAAKARVSAAATGASPASAPKPPAEPPKPREPGLLEKLGPWIIHNWFYVVSALSLALAGIFLVQYGVENGLLPPTARVAAAFAFGLLLIVAGEVIRRRFGDHEDATTAYLPSVFSGAGIVTLFGAVLSARLLYDLIGPEAALLGMVATALVAMVLGWFYGPLLAAVGLIGAFAAPYVVGGESNDPSWLFGYFAVIAVMGLGIDTIKHWTWVSVLTLVLAYASAALLGTSTPETSLAYTLFLTVLPLLTLTIPQRSLVPNHDGHMVADLLNVRSGLRLPFIPVLLVAGAMGASTLLMMTVPRGEAEVWLLVVCLLVLILAVSLWGRRADAIQDSAIAPVAGLLALVGLIAVNFQNPVFVKFRDAYAETAEADFPFTVTLFLVIGAGLSLVAAWRSQEDGRLRLLFSFAAILIAPLMGIVLELFWRPAEVIGAPVWALHAVALAGLMVWFAASFARTDGGPGLRTALAVLAALSIIAYALSIVLTFAALTVGLSVMIAVAAWLDRHYKLPQMGWFIIAGVPVISYRLLADPGLKWGFYDASLFEALLSYGGALLAALAALFLLKPLPRPNTRAVLEAGATFFAATLTSMLLFRAIDAMTSDFGSDDVWSFGLHAAVWLAAGFAQLWSLKTADGLKLIRGVAAGLFMLVGLGFVLFVLTLGNPLAGDGWFGTLVLGPPLLNTLIPEFLIPGIVLLAGAVLMTHMRRWLRGFWGILGLGLILFWGFCVIRHFWIGAPDIGLDKGMSQPELYTYTVVLLIAGAGLFYQSLASGRTLLRRAGLVVIGLAVAKVFLIDISGLQGLTRVFSLLVLGLSLAGLAWLNRWAQMRGGPSDASVEAEEPLDPKE